MKSKSNSATRPLIFDPPDGRKRHEVFTVLFPRSVASRIRYYAQERGKTPEAVIADAAAEAVAVMLASGGVQYDDDADRFESAKLNHQKRQQCYVLAADVEG